MATPAVERITSDELRSRLARHVRACDASGLNRPTDERVLFVGIYRNEVSAGTPEFSVLLRGVVEIDTVRSAVENVSLGTLVDTFHSQNLLRELRPGSQMYRQVEACIDRLGYVTLVVNYHTLRRVLEVDVEALH